MQVSSVAWADPKLRDILISRHACATGFASKDGGCSHGTGRASGTQSIRSLLSGSRPWRSTNHSIDSDRTGGIRTHNQGIMRTTSAFAAPFGLVVWTIPSGCAPANRLPRPNLSAV